MKIYFLIVLMFFLASCDIDNVKTTLKIGAEVLELIEEEQSKPIVVSTLSRIEGNVERVYFCPNESCDLVFLDFLEGAQSSITCALYELDNENISNLLIEKYSSGVSLSLVIDDRYLEEHSIVDLEKSGVGVFSDKNRGTRYNNYMHHKFCIVDDTELLLSSANPTQNGLYYNDNNLLLLESRELSQEFQKEFDQLVGGNFGYNKVQKRSIKGIVDDIGTFDVFFCPQDLCEQEILDVLQKAESEILFANFVLTLDSIEDLLIEKDSLGVEVQGVIESRMYKSKGSRAEELDDIFNLTKDSNPKTMHNKYFIVDSRYVVTGSMNPSSSGVNYNDEFMVVIDSVEIAQEFREDYFRISQ
ncbi:MAG: phospholipase D-like domain-containing protein [Nanoarchaeota archaeon]|nr:phospholipase D-like domain-containing protein [Nanoarchaeota archaeon]